MTLGAEPQTMLSSLTGIGPLIFPVVASGQEWFPVTFLSVLGVGGEGEGNHMVK